MEGSVEGSKRVPQPSVLNKTARTTRVTRRTTTTKMMMMTEHTHTEREREREKVMSRLTASYPLPRRRQHRCLAQPRGINRLSLSLPFSHPRVEHIPINYNNLDDHNGHNERIDRRVDGMIGSVVQPSVLNIRTASPSTTTKTIDGSMEGSVGGSKRVPQPSVLNNTASRTT